MNPAQWATIRELFAEARKLSQELREPFLLSSSDDEVVLAQVRTLLSNDQEDDFLEDPALGNSFTLSDTQTPEQGMKLPINLIDGYTITKILGSGASGIVYEARQAEPNRMVAIKVLRAGSMGERDRIRFQREAEMLANLRHQHIATVYAVGTTSDGSPWMAMELVSGVRLDDWAENKNTTSIVSMIQLISEALSEAHAQNIVHRDIKPANILVTNDNQPRILDFGVARNTTNSNDATIVTQTGAVIGTRTYMSPEQASGNTNIDASSDVYALGIIIKELLPQHSARDLYTIANKATDEFCSRRYPNAGDFGNDLLRWLRGEPIFARRATPLYVASLWSRRHKLICLFVLFIACALIVTYSISTSKSKAQYASKIQQAQLAYDQGDLQQMTYVLKQCNQANRNWEWHWLRQLSTTGTLKTTAQDVAVALNGTIFSSTKDGMLIHSNSGDVLGDTGKTCAKSFLSQNGNTWITLLEDGTINLYDSSSATQPTNTLQLGEPATHVAGFAISPNGKYAIVTTVTPFDPMDLATLDAKTTVSCIDLHGSKVFLHDTVSTRVLDSDEALAIANDGSSAVVSLVNGGITTWRFGERTDKREFKTTNNPCTVNINNDGTILAIAGLGGGVSNISLLEMGTLAPIKKYPIIAHDRGIVSVAISLDNTKVASIDGGGMLRITPLDGKTPIVERSQSREQSASVRFSENGEQVIIRLDDGHVRIRPTTNNTTEYKAWEYPVIRAWITPTNIVTEHANGDVRDLHVQTQKDSAFIGDLDELQTQTTSPDNARAVSLTEQVGAIQIQDSKTNQPLLSFTWPGARIIQVGFVHEGKSVLAVSVDGRIKMWSIQ